METLALTTLPFVGALVVSLAPRQTAPRLATLFALLATVATLSLALNFYTAGSETVDIPLLAAGRVALFGLLVDRISTLILFVVVFLGLLVTLYSTGYLTRGNREHPHDGSNRYYAFLLIFIGAMSGLVLSSTLGQLLFSKSPADVPRALISYYQSEKSPAFGNESAAYHPRRLTGFVSGSRHAVSQYRHLCTERHQPVTGPSCVSGVWRHPLCRVG